MLSAGDTHNPPAEVPRKAPSS